MDETFPTPDSAGHRSSVVKPKSENGKPASSVVEAIPANSTDDSPTVISANRPKFMSAEALAQGLNGQLGQFELIEAVGVGGMAAVIRARDQQLGRIVALKILPPEMAADPENIARFNQEARSAARLDHENIARVYFCGEDQGLHFIAFEFVEGIDLRTLLEKNGPLDPGQAVQYMLQVATGLAHAADRGVTHRDIKPSNILITPEGRAKIVDMGLARSTDVPGGVTQSGVTLGTFDYISPEQALEPRSADVRSDIYSLGCTFYHLLTGVPPVPDGTAAKKLHHHQNIAPRDPREFNPAIPDELVGVLGKMMAKEPRDRYQRPGELIQHLMALAQKMNVPGSGGSRERVLFVDVPLPAPPRFSPVLLAVASIAAVAILAVVLGMGGGSGEPRQISYVPANMANKPKPSPSAAGPATEAMRTAPAEPRKAANIEELVQALEQKANYIVLTGDDYDFGELAKDDERSAIRTLTAARGLKLVGDSKSNDHRPVLRWDVDAAMSATGDTSLALLTLAGGPTTQSELKNLRFEIRATACDLPVFAVDAAGLGKLVISDCEFLHDGKSEGGSIRFSGPATGGGVDLERCWFERGGKAVDISNRGSIRATDCAFGPHDVLFRFHERGVLAAAAADRNLATLNRCSVIMDAGTIFDAESNVSGTIRAGDCVFARGSDSGNVVLVRQSESRQQIRLAGPNAGQRARNGYYGLIYWAIDSDRVQKTSKDECQGQLLDADAVYLTKSPLQNPSPLKSLDKPRSTFALQPRGDLRSLSGKGLIGVQNCAFGSLYDANLVIQDEPPETATKDLVIDPMESTDESKHLYRTIGEAVANNAKQTELTLVIRASQPIEIPTSILMARPNQKLTIRSEGGKRPVLTLAESDLPNPAMFTLHSGTLILKGLHFRLKPAQSSVVNIAGNGNCQFEDCLATLEAANESNSSLVAVTNQPESLANLLNNRGPKIKLTDCFVRGRGNMLSVRGSRPFELEATNTLAALNGGFATIIGQAKELPIYASSSIACRHVTAYLSEPFLDLRSGDEKKLIGLSPTQVSAEDCLFVAASDRPLVYAAGMDRDSFKSMLKWQAARNLYGNFGRLLEIKASGAMAVMMPTEWTSTKWSEFTLEPPDSSFPKVTFAGINSDFANQPISADLVKVSAASFHPRLTGMNKLETVGAPVGADVNQLPKVDEE